MIKFLRNYALYIAWFFSCFGTLSSLYYSYLLNVEPCVFCYYQRICLFPLALILGIAAYRNDTGVKIYTAPLSFFGFCVAIYQIFLQEVPGMSLDICGRVSCTTKLYVLGFITMPMASAAAFLAIFILLLLAKSSRES